MKKFLFGFILGGVIVFGYFFVKENPQNTYVLKGKNIINKILKKEPTVGIANPASTYCIENNGILEIQESPEGQVGICKLDNGTSCEERAFFRGECTINNQEQQTGTDTLNTQTDNTTDQQDTNNETTSGNLEENTVCTMEYAPVCAKVQIQCITEPCEPIEQTFGNKCQMNANKLATFLYEGECKSE